MISKYSTAPSLLNGIPRGVNAHYFDSEAGVGGILLVLDFQSPHSSQQALFDRQKVLGLSLGIDVLNDHVDGLARVALLQVDIPHEVHIAEVLRRRECGGQDVARLVCQI